MANEISLRTQETVARAQTETLDWMVIDLATGAELWVGSEGAWRALKEFRDSGRAVGLQCMAECGCIIRGWSEPDRSGPMADHCPAHRSHKADADVAQELNKPY